MRLSCTSIGRTDRPPLLLLHGFLGRGADWRKTAEQLGEDFHCLAPDLPGHGASLSTDPEDFTLEATLDALLQVLDENGEGPATLIGYSLGGRIAMHFALRHADRVDRLVLESTSPGLRTSTEQAQRRRDDVDRAMRLRTDGLEAFLDDWDQMPLFTSLRKRPELLKKLRRSRVQNDAEGLALSLETVGTGACPSLWSRLDELQMPVLALCGEFDRKFVDLNTAMAADLPAARLCTVAGAGHNIHMEKPDVLPRAIRDFFSGTATTGA